MKNKSIQFRFYLLNIFVISIFFGCEIEEPNAPKNVKLTEIISEVSIDQNCGKFIDGEKPKTNSNSVPIISGAHQIVKGGSLILMVQPTDSAKQLIVSLRRKGPDYLAVNFGEIESGYFLIDLENNFELLQSNNSTNKSIKIKHKSSNFNNQINNESIAGDESYPLVISFSDSSKISDFNIDLAFANGSSVSKYASHNASVNPQAASSKYLQVSLNWDYPVDLDLHVITPDRNDIYYGSKSGQNGGMLDLDSNAECKIDNIDNENITWSMDEPANGIYEIKVDLWSACDIESIIPYVVTAKYKGVIKTFSGSFSSSEETYGSAFSGRMISNIFFCKVPGYVPLIIQDGPTCWAASAAMLMSWKYKKEYTVKKAMKEAGQKWLDLYNDGKGLDGNLRSQFIEDMKLKSAPIACYSPEAYYSLLMKHGLLWVIVGTTPKLENISHAIIITGIYGDGSNDKTLIEAIDPATGEVKLRYFDYFNYKFELLSKFNNVQIAYYD